MWGQGRDVELEQKGWKSQLGTLPLSIEVDGTRLLLDKATDMPEAPDVVWFTTKPVALKEGNHQLQATCPCGEAGFLFIEARSAGNLAETKPPPPSLSYKRLSPAKYEVQVTGARNPYYLIFQETFHPGWKAFIEGQEVGRHFLANAYANGYYIDRTGDYRLVLEYGPQRFFRWGLVFSFAILALCLLYLGWGLVKRVQVRM